MEILMSADNGQSVEYKTTSVRGGHSSPGEINQQLAYISRNLVMDGINSFRYSKGKINEIEMLLVGPMAKNIFFNQCTLEDYPE